MNENLDCCVDWGPGLIKLNNPIVLQSLRAGKDLYDGKPFRFCPWCGANRELPSGFPDK